MRSVFIMLLFLTSAIPFSTRADAQQQDTLVAAHSYDIVFSDSVRFDEALEALVARGQQDILPTIILAMRYRDYGQRALFAAFEDLTGEQVDDWFDAALWQEAHAEIVPHPSFRDLKLQILTTIDPAFKRFLGGAKSDRENMDIRLEEIFWGGVRVDGIPALDNPRLVEAGNADYLADSDLVFGVEINGDARAYPLRIMGWHEMFNDVVGGVPVSLAYCTLCGSGILYEGQVEGQNEAFTFGSSGFLYRSNKLMYDRQTDSLWNQFTGEPVVGALKGSGIKLKMRPVVITSWQKWRVENPKTRVLSLETGFKRDYGSGVVYSSYFASDDLMFPALVGDERSVKRKDFVFGMREAGGAKAWPLSLFEDGAVFNDKVGFKNVVVIGDAETRTVRAYYRGKDTFSKSESPSQLTDSTGTPWKIEESFLVSNNGRKLPRAAGHVAYWFAWNSYLGNRSEFAAGE